MSGGTWGYQAWKIQETAEEATRLIQLFLKAVGESEHIVDWAESGDSVRRSENGSGAERDLYDLWLKTFHEVFG
jgi:hypothetical protein